MSLLAPRLPKSVRKRKYFCSKCKRWHFTTSKIGKKHRKFKSEMFAEVPASWKMMI